jgi:hypothetical protein
LRKFRKSETVVLEEYYDYSSISTSLGKILIFLRNDRDYKDVDSLKTRKRYVVIESLDFMQNIFWLASCFSKKKKSNSHFLRTQPHNCIVHYVRT